MNFFRLHQLESNLRRLATVFTLTIFNSTSIFISESQKVCVLPWLFPLYFHFAFPFYLLPYTHTVSLSIFVGLVRRRKEEGLPFPTSRLFFSWHWLSDRWTKMGSVRNGNSFDSFNPSKSIYILRFSQLSEYHFPFWLFFLPTSPIWFTLWSAGKLLH